MMQSVSNGPLHSKSCLHSSKVVSIPKIILKTFLITLCKTRSLMWFGLLVVFDCWYASFYKHSQDMLISPDGVDLSITEDRHFILMVRVVVT